MLKSYLKTAIRTLLKSRIFSTINIFGLAIGMASTLLIAHYVKFERSYERHYTNADNIYRITLDLYNDGEFIVNDCETYQTLGPEFKSTMPEVIDFARFFHLGTSEIYVSSTDTRNYEHMIYFADASAFTLFDYNVKFGDPAAVFDKPHKVLVNESTANKYFGRTNIVGERIEIGSRDTPFEVVGVIEDLPQNTHLKFDILISHATIPKIWSWYEKYPWGGNNEYTYLLMSPEANLKAFNAKIEEYSLNNDKIEDEIVIAEHITDIHLYSNKTFEPEVNGSAQTVNFMVIIAIFILLLAWVNYVNLSTSKALERAKEVGVRKVVGSSK
ncbi:MAG: ABC transporter permease, partial [Bacteroidota bacterium]